MSAALTPPEEAEARTVEKALAAQAVPSMRGRISGLVFSRASETWAHPPHPWPLSHRPVDTGGGWLVYVRRRSSEGSSR